MVPNNQQKNIDIKKFFTMSTGDWLTQKTSYSPNSKQHTTSTITTSVTKVDKSIILSSESAQKADLPNNNDAAIYNISSKKDHKEASSILTYAYNKESASHGNIYKLDSNKKGKIIKGKFNLSEGVLKILVNKGTLSIEETIWFINKNLRLTKSITKKQQNCVLISFSSEIKIKSDT